MTQADKKQMDWKLSLENERIELLEECKEEIKAYLLSKFTESIDDELEFFEFKEGDFIEITSHDYVWFFAGRAHDDPYSIIKPSVLPNCYQYMRRFRNDES